MTVECDVIVVGGGMAGAGVAAELASNRRVVVLEQEEHPGIHATGRSAALHSEIYGNATIRLLTQASRDFFLEGVDGQPFATDRGCIYIATEDTVDRIDTFLEEPSVKSAVDRIDAEEVYRLIPSFRPGVIVAALAERNAYDLDVDAIHRFFLKKLRQHGGALHCSSGVTALDHDGTAWTVTAGEQSFRAPVVVNAAGAWGDVVARLAGVAPVGLEPKRRTAVLVDPPAGAHPERWPAVIDIAEQFYFKPEAGKILMSPADETPSDPCDAWPEDMDMAIAVDRVQQVLDIEVNRISHSWAGLRTFSPDRTPVVGYDAGSPGFFWLVGQGGYGIQTSAALSRLAAALVREEGVPADLAAMGLDLAVLSPNRFSGRQA